MKLKKIISVTLAMVLVLCMFTACGKNDDTKTDKETTPGPTTAGNDTPTTGGNKDKIVTIKWAQVGGGTPTNYDAWSKKLNAYLNEKIGVNLEVQVVSWADWDTRRSVMVNTNDDYDIIFTNLGTYTGDIRIGAYLDITELVKTASPELYKSIPVDYWNACSVDGKIYGVPAYKDSSVTEYFVWDKAIAEKYEIDITALTTLESLTEPLKKIKDGERKAPFVINSGGVPQIMDIYDSMSTGLPAVGVRYDDETRTVVSVFEQPEIMARLETLHGWYKEGIINADAPTLPETPDYRMCFIAQGWSLAAKTTWGPKMGVEAEAIKWGDTLVSNGSVQGSLSCISANSKNPEKALQLLELVNTDSKVRDALYYGLEGDNFEYTADGKVHKLNEEWKMAGYTQGTFFNVTPLDTVTVNEWDEVKELNNNAIPSVLIGFTFNSETVEDELANCNVIWERYKKELLCGAKDPKEGVPALMKELRANGFDKIMAEAQAQVDAAYK